MEAEPVTPPPEPGCTWLARLSRELDATAGVPAGTFAVDEQRAADLLDAARDVAHGSGDRRNAPLACYLLGLWVQGRAAAGVDPRTAFAEARTALDRVLEP